MNQEFYQELCGHIPQEAILLQELMKRHTTFKIGGPADYYLAPDRQQMVDALAIAQKHNVPVTIIGNGSNLLVRDGGIRGLVMEIGRPMSEVTVDGTKIHAGAGAMLGALFAAVICTMMFNIIGGLIALLVAGGGGLFLVIHFQSKGLHSKEVNAGTYIVRKVIQGRLGV